MHVMSMCKCVNTWRKMVCTIKKVICCNLSSSTSCPKIKATTEMVARQKKNRPATRQLTIKLSHYKVLLPHILRLNNGIEIETENTYEQEWPSLKYFFAKAYTTWRVVTIHKTYLAALKCGKRNFRTVWPQTLLIKRQRNEWMNKHQELDKAQRFV